MNALKSRIQVFTLNVFMFCRSHWNSCYAHSNRVDETYLIPEAQQKLSSGLPLPKDSVLNMDLTGKKILARDKRLALL